MRTGILAISIALLVALPAAASTGLTKKDNATLHDSIKVPVPGSALSLVEDIRRHMAAAVAQEHAENH